MNIGQIITHDIANGPGMRISLFVSGCSRHCPGCFNEMTWNPSYGMQFHQGMRDELLKELAQPYYQGISILGGEPFEPYNRDDVLDFVKQIKADLPDRDIWIYSGYVYEELMKETTSREILNLADVLVDGPFILEKRDLMLPYRGSDNQRIIDLRRSDDEHVELSPYMVKEKMI